ncbi:hypothetical protein EV360DRAFT_70735 [Lentinula raphanica]|nr:hypothetical protein EV360DRAFT_70735 [Lentinula raphanica]
MLDEDNEEDMDLSEEQRGELSEENNVDDRLTKRCRINYSASPELESSSDKSAQAQPIIAQAGPAFQGLITDSDTEDEDEVQRPDVAPPIESEIEDIRVIQDSEFRESIQNATLANGKLDGLTIQRL